MFVDIEWCCTGEILLTLIPSMSAAEHGAYGIRGNMLYRRRGGRAGPRVRATGELSLCSSLEKLPA